MNGKRLFQFLAIIILSSAVALPAGARTSDAPAFGVWLAQWSQYGRVHAKERLPCLHAVKTQCNGVFPARSARKATVRRHAVKSTRSKHHKVALNKVRRVKSRGHGPAARATAGTFSWTAGGLMLADLGVGKLLTITPGAVTGGAPADGTSTDRTRLDVPTLDAFLSDAVPPENNDAPVVTDAAAGVGNNAYGALYDFEDDGAGGGDQRGFQEISSLLAAPPLLAAATQVSEPGTMLLVGGALLALRWSSQRRSRRGALLPGAF